MKKEMNTFDLYEDIILEEGSNYKYVEPSASVVDVDEFALPAVAAAALAAGYVGAFVGQAITNMMK